MFADLGSLWEERRIGLPSEMVSRQSQSQTPQSFLLRLDCKCDFCERVMDKNTDGIAWPEEQKDMCVACFNLAEVKKIPSSSAECLVCRNTFNDIGRFFNEKAVCLKCWENWKTAIFKSTERTTTSSSGDLPRKRKSREKKKEVKSKKQTIEREVKENETSSMPQDELQEYVLYSVHGQADGDLGTYLVPSSKFTEGELAHLSKRKNCYLDDEDDDSMMEKILEKMPAPSLETIPDFPCLVTKKIKHFVKFGIVG